MSMYQICRKFLGLAAVVCLTLASGIASADAIAEGKKVALDRKKGNCLGCHMIMGEVLPGNIGPPLIAMKARYPNKADLREQIHDARIKNPNTIMPPFGAHRVLTEKEVDLVTEYIYSL